MSRTAAALALAVLGALAAAASAGCGPPPHRADDRAARLEALFRRACDQDGVTGGLVLARAGEILWQAQAGPADRATGRMLDAHSVYEWASAGKAFTAMAVLTLARDGRLGLDDPAARHLPELRGASCTLRQLLQHTAGLPDYLDEMPLREAPDGLPVFIHNSDVVAWLASGRAAPRHAPGAAFEYSNTHYVVLASVVEVAGGEPFGAYLERAVFAPLGMSSARSFTVRFRDGEVPADYAFGYVADGAGGLALPEQVERDPSLAAFSTLEGDGTVICSLPDLALWEAAWTTDVLVPAALREQAFAPPRLADGSLSDYGFGWTLDLERGRIEHRGAWPGVRSGVFVDPRTRTLFACAFTAPLADRAWVEEAVRIAFGEE